MDVVRLRVLTKKSKVLGGKFDGQFIQTLLDLHNYQYLRYCYYNYSAMSFTNDILDEIGITEEFRIEKPGVKIGFEQYIWKMKHENLSDDIIKSQLHRKEMRQKSLSVRQSIDYRFKKGYLQSKNHGK
jgi:hypothetical protein